MAREGRIGKGSGETVPGSLNRAELIGRLGADATVNHLVSGGRVANMSIATDESYLDRSSVS